MSCDCCAHWSDTARDRYTDYEKEPGVCARYPVHIETKRNHTCGELTIALKTRFPWSNEISPLAQFREDNARDRNEFRMERDKRLALEKKIKALRVQLKTKTVKKPEMIL